MAGWDDEQLGAFGSGAQVPTDTWFPVDTTTGAWQLPGVPPASIGATLSSVPASTGPPDQAPLAIGQVAGGFGAPMTTPRSMQRVQRLDQMGALTPARSPWQDVLTAVGGAAAGGPGIAQAFGRQEALQQQALQNRVVLRRQMLQEDQEARAATQEGYRTLVAISQIKNKALRNMQFDRFAAQAAEAGQPLPTDFIDTYKKSTLAEGEGIAQAYGPLLAKAGFSQEQTARILESGDLDTIKGLLEGGLKVKKQQLEEEESADLTAGLATLGGASGVPAPRPAQPGAPLTGPPTPAPAPATPGVPATPGAPTTARGPGQRVNLGLDTPAPMHRAIVAEANRQGVDPQVALALVNQESGFDPAAIGAGGEVGMFQFTEGAAKDMGTTKAALRNNPGLQIEKGIGFLKKKFDESKGVLNAALTRYNGGGDPNYVAHVTRYLAPARALISTLDSAPPGAPTAPSPTGPPTAPTGGTPQEQAQLTDLTTRIAAMDTFITANAGKGSDRAKATVAAIERQRDNLAKERDKLETRLGKAQERVEEPGKIRTRQEIEQPFALERAREQRALTPIDAKTQEVLANNKSVYRSIGKIEQYFREGTDLPEDFVNLVAQDAPGIRAAMAADPKNATGILEQWEKKLQGASNDPNVNRFLSALGNMRDLIIRERSGGSVTGNELDRAMGAFMGSLPNVNQAFSLFMQNLANVKETVVDVLVTSGAAARPLSGGKAMYGSLPKEVRERIDYAERGEEPPKAQMPAKRPQVTGPITQVSP